MCYPTFSSQVGAKPVRILYGMKRESKDGGVVIDGAYFAGVWDDRLGVLTTDARLGPVLGRAVARRVAREARQLLPRWEGLRRLDGRGIRQLHG